MANSLAHTKWVCKYHIVFAPKYRRKIIYNQLRADIQKDIRDLCKWKGIEIIEGHMSGKLPKNVSIHQFKISYNPAENTPPLF
jgi:putative transposase